MVYDAQKLEQYAAAIMEKVGLSPEKAARFAESLLVAEKRGITSHGLTRLKAYSYRLEAGLVDAQAEPTVLSDAPSFLLVDANNGLGVCMAHEVMEMCVERARETGACFAAVRGGNHFGIGAYFSDYAAQNDMIGVAVTNGPKAIAPTGGKEALFGTNPLSVSIPAGKYRNFTLDMATSMVARGKVTLAKKEGRSIPEGWGIDANGNPTTDPAQVKTMLPFGGPKGYGIAMIIEILCSCLSGAATGLTMGSFYDYSGKKQDVGYFLGALDISRITPIDDFKARMDGLIETVKGSQKAAGVQEIFVPGEIELNKAQRTEQEGVKLSEAVLAELKEIGEKYGVPFNCEKE